ncbi:MAG TPA: choice-of-anchor tandem repeat GloVer-containing protein [Mariniphaga sp.]|nr:choice-of-anchor tandem repeat GloVer-containing protein [Mariniphaga sp.]
MKTNYSIYTLLILVVIIHQSSKGQELWGVTMRGGSFDKGVIFKLDPNGDKQEVVFSFEAMGYPEGRMTEYSDSIFFGTTTKRNDFGIGGIFKFNSNKGQFTKLLDFDSENVGVDGAGSLLLASNNKLYGMTKTGGAYNHGIIYEFDPETEVYTKKLDFNESISGKWPIGALVEGEEGYLYGITSEGGDEGSGIIFSYNYITETFTKIIDLQSETMGSSPEGGLIIAADGMLYGTAREGGDNGYGVIFKFDPVTITYEVLFAFDGEDHGSYPACTLLEGSNGNLYGTTSSGGSFGYGLIFEFDFINNIFIKRLENSGPYSDKVVGSLVEAPNNKLYAMSMYSDSHGVRMYEIDPVQGTYRDYILAAEEMRYGENCHESISVASNGRLFLWGWDTFYVDNEIFLFEFKYEEGEVAKYYKNQTFLTGSYPTGNLVMAENGNLYGTGSRGGMYDLGVLFEYNPITEKYSKLIDFDNESYGAVPMGSPIIINDSVMYGMTSKGGNYNKGVIYEYRTNSGTFTKLLDFDGEERGEGPEGSLMPADNGKLYGMTTFGGLYNNGVIFSFEPGSRTYTKLFDFEELVTGSNPYSTLIQASNGKVYGTTSKGSRNERGVFFEFDIETNHYKIVKDDGSSLFELMEASNGNIYLSGSSMVYEYNPVDGVFNNTGIPSIDGRIGKMFEYAPNKLLGMNYGELWYLGGPNTDGDVFEIDMVSGAGRIVLEFSGENGRHPHNSGFIKVDNRIGPEVVCQPVDLYLDDEGNAVLHPEDIDHGCSGDNIQLSLNKTNFNCNDMGENTVILTVTDENGLSNTCNALVTVLDTISPEVKSKDIEIYLNADGIATIEPEDIDAGSFDICEIEHLSVNIKEFDCNDLGDNQVELVATDLNGNKSKSMAIVSVHDTIAPDIVCHSELVQYLPPYQNFIIFEEEEWKSVAEDNCSIAALNYLFTGTQPLEISSADELKLGAGNFEVEWTAIDPSGNESVCAGGLMIQKRPTTLLLLENELEVNQGKIIVQALLLDSLLVEGIHDMSVEVSSGTFTEIYKTNSKGVIKIEMPINSVNSTNFDLSLQFDGNETYMGSSAESELVTGIHFETVTDVQVYPNPFSESVYFEFVSPVTADARIDLFDANGRLVKTLIDQHVFAGKLYSVEFMPNNESGGLFLYRLVIGNHTSTGKVNYQR